MKSIFYTAFISFIKHFTDAWISGTLSLKSAGTIHTQRYRLERISWVLSPASKTDRREKPLDHRCDKRAPQCETKTNEERSSEFYFHNNPQNVIEMRLEKMVLRIRVRAPKLRLTPSLAWVIVV
ncbi:hypothetical protein PoB_001792100 [Plakobranchus ocellatus]|uniref:Uncharacterized protein n=1 Tax=Plakobranchus ocellatus TaxID=259542 RepID=A0AAV3YWD6_9GAST|nr:hypothetical protein PoB_001792100 [Plakobranchus ocellatus]